MLPYIKSILAYVGAIGIVGVAVFLFANSYTTSDLRDSLPGNATTSTAQTLKPQDTEVSSPQEIPPQVAKPEKAPVSQQKPTSPPASSASSPSTSTTNGEPSANNNIERIQSPYSFPPYSFELVNVEARAALVNISCSMNTGNTRRIVVASGVFIDQRGIILTNAHVAQYILLSNNLNLNLTCTIGSGSPARPRWIAEILYIPPVWVREHARNITEEVSTGTGEHDYALLRVTGTQDGSALPPTFPSLSPDTREAIGFPGDSILTASYPAEFLEGSKAQFELYPITSITTVRELLTFESYDVDLISVGGIAGAQGGSSGGGVVNAWGQLIGIITTTSEGATTAERDLRAITLNYIDRDLTAQTGSGLSALLSGDITAKAADFNAYEASSLINLLIEEISN